MKNCRKCEGQGESGKRSIQIEKEERERERGEGREIRRDGAIPYFPALYNITYNIEGLAKLLLFRDYAKNANHNVTEAVAKEVQKFNYARRDPQKVINQV